MMSTTHSNQKKQKRVTSILLGKPKEQPEKDKKRTKRVQSIQYTSTGGIKQKKVKSTKIKTKKEEVNQVISGLSSSKKEEKKAEISDQSHPHFMTVADLTSGDFVEPSPIAKTNETPVRQFNQESTLKLEDHSQIPPQTNSRIRKQLQQTMGKLKAKQDTIDMLTRTIQTRLVDGSVDRAQGNSRLDVYEVQINFYVEKISELQRQLHQKGKALEQITDRSNEFNMVVKNNRKLISENHRLREEKELLERQNNALKAVFLKRAQH